MKWTYSISTFVTRESRRTDSPNVLTGIYYGDFAGATQQVAHAVACEGWAKNSVDVVIRITPGDKDQG